MVWKRSCYDMRGPYKYKIWAGVETRVFPNRRGEERVFLVGLSVYHSHQTPKPLLLQSATQPDLLSIPCWHCTGSSLSHGTKLCSIDVAQSPQKPNNPFAWGWLPHLAKAGSTGVRGKGVGVVKCSKNFPCCQQTHAGTRTHFLNACWVLCTQSTHFLC